MIDKQKNKKFYIVGNFKVMKMYLRTNVQRYTKNNRHTVSIRDVLAVCAYYDLGLYYFGFIAQKKKKETENHSI